MSRMYMLFALLMVSLKEAHSSNPLSGCTEVIDTSKGSASSNGDAQSDPLKALDFSGFWNPLSTDKMPYIQAGVGSNGEDYYYERRVVSVTAVEMQAGKENFNVLVTRPGLATYGDMNLLRRFKIAFSNDLIGWKFIRRYPLKSPHDIEFEGMYFRAPYDQEFSYVFPWVNAKYLRLFPIKLDTSKNQLRLKLLSCPAFAVPAISFCPPGQQKWLDDISCIPVASCASRWTSNGGYCYRLYTNPFTYAAALTSCQTQGADLVSIHSAAERDFINTNIIGSSVSDAWIGLQDSDQKYDLWSDTSVNDFVNYDYARMFDGTEYCVKISRTNSYKWEDTSCSKSLPYICKVTAGCRRRLVGPVSETKMTAPGGSVTGHGPEQARMNPSGTTTTGWRPVHNDGAYIQINLGSVHRLAGVIVKSSGYYDPVQWFILHYSADGTDFRPYVDGFIPRLFRGSMNDSMVTEWLPNEVSALQVQIHPKAWIGPMYTIWVELIGCKGSVSSSVPDGCIGGRCSGTCESITGGARCKCPAGTRLSEDYHTCLIESTTCPSPEAAGLTDGFIIDWQITSNSEQAPNTAANVRLNGASCWCTQNSNNKKRHFLTVDLKMIYKVKGVKIQNGGAGAMGGYTHLTTYKLAFSFDGEAWQFIRTTDKFYDVSFEFTAFTSTPGNDDTVVQEFPVTTTRYLRLYPIMAASTFTCVRMEILLKPPNSCSAPAVSPCYTSRHGCSHTCIPTPSGYVCQCPDGYHLMRDGKTCDKDQHCSRMDEFSFMGRCYLKGTADGTHTQAEQRCNYLGGRLLDIQTVNEMHFAAHRAQYGSLHYIGLSDINRKFLTEDMTGYPVEAFKWLDEDALGTEVNADAVAISPLGYEVEVNPTTVASYLCRRGCEDFKVTGAAGVLDASITASTEQAGHEAPKARITGSSSVGWTPSDTINAYLQVVFTDKTKVTGIITESGVADLTYGVVTEYEIQCRYLSGGSYTGYKELFNTKRTFLAPPEPMLTSVQMLDYPIHVYGLRIYPKVWTKTNYRLKFEVLGCQESAVPLAERRKAGTGSSPTDPSSTDHRRIYDNLDPTISFYPYEMTTNFFFKIERNVGADVIMKAFLVRRYPTKTAATGLKVMEKDMVTWQLVDTWRTFTYTDNSSYSLEDSINVAKRSIFFHNTGGTTFHVGIEVVAMKDGEGGKGVDLVDNCFLTFSCQHQCSQTTYRVGSDCTCSGGYHLGTNLHSCFQDGVRNCPAHENLGLESGFIQDHQLSASSEQVSYEASKGGLNDASAWCTSIDDQHPWLQISLREAVDVIGVQVQTGASQIGQTDVLYYFVATSRDHVIWHFFHNGNKTAFWGPIMYLDDPTTALFHYSLSAHFIRIYILPHHSTNSHCLRAEVLILPAPACQTYLNVDECATGTHACTHLCTDTVTGYTCSCPTGYILLPDGMTCVPENTCKAGEHAFGGYCYMIFTTPKAYLDARYHCQTINSFLLTLNTQSESDFICTIVPNTKIWLGLNHFGVWIDDTPMSYYKPQENTWPVTGSFDCVVLNPDNSGLWERHACTETFPYVCKSTKATREGIFAFPTIADPAITTTAVCPCHQKNIAGVCVNRNYTVPTNLSCTYNCVAKLTLGATITYRVTQTCPDCDWSPVWGYTWSTANNSCTLSFDTPCGKSDSSCRFKTKAISTDATCHISLAVVDQYCPYFKSKASVSLPANNPPSLGTCQVSPSEGTALTTLFSFSCSGYMDEDMPVIFSCYVYHDEGGEGTLLYQGYAATMPGRLLKQGSKETGYLVTLKIVAMDRFGATTSKSFTVKVMPLIASSNKTSSNDLATLQVLENLISTDNSSSNSSNMASLIEAGDIDGAVALVSVVGTMLNSVPAAEMEAAEKRTQLRKDLITTVSKLALEDDLVKIKTRAIALRVATSNTSEITTTAQNVAADHIGLVSERMKKTVKTTVMLDEAVLETASKELLEGTMNVLESSLQVLYHTKNTTKNKNDTRATTHTDGAITDDEARNQTKKIGMGVESIIENVADSVLDHKLPGEKASVIKAQGMSLHLEKAKANQLSEKTINVTLEGSLTTEEETLHSQVSLPDLVSETASAESSPTDEMSVQVHLTNKNPYAWQNSSESVTTSVLGMALKDSNGKEVMMSDLEKPVKMHIPTTSSLIESIDEVEMRLNLTKSFDSADVVMFKYSIPGRRQYSITLEPELPDLPYRLLVKENSPPKMTEFSGSSAIQLPSNILSLTTDTLSGRQLYKMHRENEGTENITLYLALLPDVYHKDHDNMISARKAANMSMTVNWHVGLLKTQCLFWNKTEMKWTDTGCRVDQKETNEHLMVCECNHLTVFSGGFFVAPNALNISEDILLFRTFFDNPIVVCLVIFVWIMYILLVIWARRKDKEDLEKYGVTFLHDNMPISTHGYLVTVFTGWRTMAGTTANVALYLTGDHKTSDTHWLYDPERKRFEPGSQDSYLLMTDYIGRLKSINIWHDGSGSSPSWFLVQIIVTDLQDGENYFFICNDWLTPQESSGSVHRRIDVADEARMKEFKHIFLSRNGLKMRDEHLLVGIFSRPPYSPFTRVQRVTCLISFLLIMMLANIMFYGVDTDDPEDQLSKDNITISLSQIVIGVQTSLIAIPVFTIIVQLFRLARPRPNSTMKWRACKNISGTTFHSAIGTLYQSHEGSEVRHTFQSLTPSECSACQLTDIHVDSSTNSVNPNSPIEADFVTDIRVDSSTNSVNSDSPIEADFETVIRADSSTNSVNPDSPIEADFETDIRVDRSTKPVNPDSPIEADFEIQIEGPGSSGDNKSGPDGDTQKEFTQSLIKQKGKQKKEKEPFMLPWWSIYIGWVLCICICVFSSFFVMLYGLQYGYTKSVAWVTSILTSFLQDACINQPLKLTLFTAVLTCFVRKPFETNGYVGTHLHTYASEELLHYETIRRYLSRQKVEKDHSIYTPPSDEHVINVRRKLLRHQEARDILREIFVYGLFLVVLCIVVYGHNDHHAFPYFSTTKSVFLDAGYAGYTMFEEVRTVDDMWDYLEHTFVPALHMNEYYNGQIMDQIGATADHASYIVGVPRIKQIRTSQGTCKPPIQGMSFPCKPEYIYAKADTKSYSAGWTPLEAGTVSNKRTSGWLYRSPDTSDMGPVMGRHAWYPGGGYIFELSTHKHTSLYFLDLLKTNGWVDEHTRAVYVEFTSYNPPTGLFSVGLLLFEFTDVGDIEPYYHIMTCRLYPYTSFMDMVTAACEVAFLLFLLVFLWREIMRLTRDGKSYFKNFWNWLQIIIILLGTTAVVLFFYKWFKMRAALAEKKRSSVQRFVSFYPSALAHYMVTYILGALICLTTVFFIRLLQFNYRILLFIHVLRKASDILIGFSWIVVIFFIGLTAVGLLAFGHVYGGFKNFTSTLVNIFCMTMGELKLEELEIASPVTGPAFYGFLLMTIYFGMVPLFIVILENALKDVRKENKEMKRDLEILDQVWEKLTVNFGLSCCQEDDE